MLQLHLNRFLDKLRNSILMKTFFIRSTVIIFVAITVVFLCTPFVKVQAQELPVERTNANQQESYVVGIVEWVGELTQTTGVAGDQVRDVRVQPKNEQDAQSITAQFYDNLATNADDVVVGDQVVVLRTEAVQDEVLYIITDKYRLPSMAILLVIFFVSAIIFAGKKGFTAMLGLGISLLVLMWYTIPFIMSGSSPFFVATISAFLIAILSLVIAHGFTKQTGIALLSTLTTLALSLGLAQVFVSTAKLVGTGSEEAFFLSYGGLENIDVRGLLLAGIIIGVLGVLDDVTTAQTASIKQIAKAGVRNWKQLYRTGKDVGIEHIVSLVNTLALAYVGASLPMLLMFFVNEGTLPFWVVLNGQMITEEIVRTLVGSTALILAVPISTLTASWFYAKFPGISQEKNNRLIEAVPKQQK